MPDIPEGAKTPEDHKPKAEEPPPTVSVKIKGREWSIPREALDDFELMDDLAQLDDDGNIVRAASCMRRLFGETQRREIMDTLRDPETGRVSIEAGTGFLMDVFEAANQAGEAPNS